MAVSLNAARIATSSRSAPFKLALLTDPRVPVSQRSIDALPHPSEIRCAVIFRHYDLLDRASIAHELCLITRAAGHFFLVAGDPRLATEVGAHGVHLPEWQIGELASIKKAHREWLISAACHSGKALQSAAAAGADCATLSPVFSTKSHPDIKPLGTDRFSRLTKRADLPVLALGGVTEMNAHQLISTGAAGIAAIGALSDL